MITSQIMQGEVERGGIENFFHELSLQGRSVLAEKVECSMCSKPNGGGE